MFNPVALRIHDHNADGRLDAADEENFLAAWEPEDPAAAVPPQWRRPRGPVVDVLADGSYDVIDFLTFQTCLGRDSAGCVTLFDINKDAVVDITDYELYAHTWSGPDEPHNFARGSKYGNPFLWTGQRYEAETGLYQFVYRSYSPTLGRWLQRDKLGVLGIATPKASTWIRGAPSATYRDQVAGRDYSGGPVLFEYAASNPLAFTDPEGLFFGIPDIVVTTAGRGAIAGMFVGGAFGAIGGGLDPDMSWQEGLLLGMLSGAAGGGVGGGVYAFMGARIGILGTALTVGATDGAVEGFVTSWLAGDAFVDSLYHGAGHGSAMGFFTAGLLNSKTARAIGGAIWKKMAQYVQHMSPLRIGTRSVRAVVGQGDLLPTQADVSQDVVEDYARRLVNGEMLPPIQVVNVPGQGRYIVDGHHRYIASQLTGIPVDIIEGSGVGPVGFSGWGGVDWE